MLCLSSFALIIILVAVNRCAVTELDSKAIAKDRDGCCPRKKPQCNYPCTDPIPRSCLTSSFPDCNCPPGYALFTDFSSQLSYCQETCFNLDESFGCDVNAFGQCLGTRLTSSCNFATNIDQKICSSQGIPCGELMIYNGNFFCVDFANATSSIGTCIPSTFNSQCVNVFGTGCTTLTDDQTSNLLSISCAINNCGNSQIKPPSRPPCCGVKV